MTATQRDGEQPLMKAAEDISLLDFMTPLVRRWKLLVALPLAAAVLAGVGLLLVPPVYTANTTLTSVTSPTGGLSGTLASLAGLVGSLGLTASPNAGPPPQFFAELLRSRELLQSTLKSRFNDPRDPGQHRLLLEIMGMKGRSYRERLGKGVRKLDGSVRAKADGSTGIVTLTVKAHDPQLAADIANRMTSILDSFNLGRQQSQSREQSRFTRERLAEAERELHQAERAQLRFLQANREYHSSPLLQFEASRLDRAVQLKQEVYVSLAKEYDEARIAEVRDTPIITIIDSAAVPDRRSSPRPLLIVVVAVIAGVVLSMMLAFVLEYRTRASFEAGPEYSAFQRAWSEARGEIAAAFKRR